MNQRVDGDEDLQKPVRHPADEIRRDHRENDSRHFPMRTLFHFGTMFATDLVKTNENEDVERRDHRRRNEKAQEETVVGKDDFRGNGEKYGGKIDHTSKEKKIVFRFLCFGVKNIRRLVSSSHLTQIGSMSFSSDTNAQRSGNSVREDSSSRKMKLAEKHWVKRYDQRRKSQRLMSIIFSTKTTSMSRLSDLCSLPVNTFVFACVISVN